jgi:hypothetical protein
MYIRKDIHKSLRLEAKMAEGSHCHSWSKLFQECSYLLKKKDKEIERLRDENNDQRNTIEFLRAEIDKLTKAFANRAALKLPLPTQENGE